MPEVDVDLVQFNLERTFRGVAEVAARMAE
jgi:hypothetical protein